MSNYVTVKIVGIKNCYCKYLIKVFVTFYDCTMTVYYNYDVKSLNSGITLNETLRKAEIPEKKNHEHFN